MSLPPLYTFHHNILLLSHLPSPPLHLLPHPLSLPCTLPSTPHSPLFPPPPPPRSVPFDKEELNAILKFGADELFKSGGEGGLASEDKALQELDIDDILSRAETQATAEDTSHSDLLSQFKVASFAMDEDELAPPPSATPTDGGKKFLLSPRGSGQAPVEKTWEELIPEDVRRRVDEEERAKEQLELYLPPRQRKIQVRGAGGQKYNSVFCATFSNL